jgi:hypothetical protein
MNIAVVGQQPEYFTMTQWALIAFKDIGHETIWVDRNNIKIPEDVDLVLFMDCSEDYSANISEIKQVKVFWSLDCHMPGGTERSVNIARKSDIVFSTNYEHGLKILEKFGIESFLLPVTYLVNYQMMQEFKYPLDISMVGHANSKERIQLWEIINNYPNSFGGNTGSLTEYLKSFNSKIVVNQPTEPWNIILNNRFFEGMAFGALVLQKRLQTTLIEKLGFIDNQDFVYWNDFDDLKEKLDYYLGHIKEREIIANNGMEKVRFHCMENQCKTILKIVLSKFYDRF